ncbi:unnamed protein product [Cochlearia groenlandica]
MTPLGPNSKMKFFEPSLARGKQAKGTRRSCLRQLKRTTRYYFLGLRGPENQKEYIIGQFHRCLVPLDGLINAVVNKIWGRNCGIYSRKLGAFTYLFHVRDETTRNWILQRGL